MLLLEVSDFMGKHCNQFICGMIINQCIIQYNFFLFTDTGKKSICLF